MKKFKMKMFSDWFLDLLYLAKSINYKISNFPFPHPRLRKTKIILDSLDDFWSFHALSAGNSSISRICFQLCQKVFLVRVKPDRANESMVRSSAHVRDTLLFLFFPFFFPLFDKVLEVVIDQRLFLDPLEISNIIMSIFFTTKIGNPSLLQWYRFRPFLDGLMIEVVHARVRNCDIGFTHPIYYFSLFPFDRLHELRIFKQFF